MQPRVTVLCSMTTVDLEQSLVVKLFKDYGLPLETLGVDLLNIFKNKLSSALYLQSLTVDLEEILEVSNIDVSLFEVIADLQLLLAEITRNLFSIYIQNSKLVNIQFQERNTLVLEFIRL